MANIGYYHDGLGRGSAAEADEIVEVGHTPVDVTSLTPQVLATLKVLVIQNPSNVGYSAALVAALPAIQQAVANGLVVIIFDRHVTGAASLFPAGNGITMVRDVLENLAGSQQMNLGPQGSLIATTAFGAVTDTSLDNGNRSNHGYALASSLPSGSEVLLTRDNPAQVTAFTVFSGLGAFIYTTAPEDFYDNAAPGSVGVWEDFYVNMLIHGMAIAGIEPNPLVAVDDTVEVTEGVATTLNLLANETYSGGGSLRITAINGTAIAVGQTVTLASGSTVKLNANGALTYLSGGTANNINRGQSGSETFTYTVADGTGPKANTDIGQVNVNIAGDYTRIDGTGKSETLNGTAFDDTIDGKAGMDILYGNAGNDILNGGGGGQSDADQMYGGVGDDTYYVDSTRDLVSEVIEEGHDKVISSVSNYTLTANVEDLVLATGALNGTGNDLANAITGNAAANIINGIGGNDELDGGDGNDTLYGGAGGDSLFGGTGADTFIYKAVSDSQATVTRPPAGAQAAPVLGAGANTDVIYDLNISEGDKIDLTAIDASTRVAGNDDFVVVNAFTKVAGQMTVKTFGGLSMKGESGGPLNAHPSVGYILEGDTNGDGMADFTLLFNSPTALTVNDLRAAILGVSAWNITSIGSHASAPSAIQTTIPDLFH